MTASAPRQNNDLSTRLQAGLQHLQPRLQAFARHRRVRQGAWGLGIFLVLLILGLLVFRL